MIYPHIRLRRNRSLDSLRESLLETTLRVQDLIWPLFVVEGNNIVNPVENLPGVSRYSIDTLIIAINNAYKNFGLKIFALFPVINIENKDEQGSDAVNPNNLVCRAVKEIKDKLPADIVLITDVALDPYTLSGHDGILVDGKIDNDQTVEILCKQAVNQAKAGSDIIAPSDMMDGRILKIRQALDQENLQNVCLLSYAIKYCTKLYQPFRNIVNVQRTHIIDKSSYQLNLANTQEAMREIAEDIKEGTDLVMIKPGMMCLDIIYQVKQTFNIPIFAYHVSGEYFLLKNAENVPDFQARDILYEQLLSMKRAGAQCIFTYGALEIAKFIINNRC